MCPAHHASGASESSELASFLDVPEGRARFIGPVSEAVDRAPGCFLRERCGTRGMGSAQRRHGGEGARVDQGYRLISMIEHSLRQWGARARVTHLARCCLNDLDGRLGVLELDVSLALQTLARQMARKSCAYRPTLNVRFGFGAASSSDSVGSALTRLARPFFGFGSDSASDKADDDAASLAVEPSSAFTFFDLDTFALISMPSGSVWTSSTNADVRPPTVMNEMVAGRPSTCR